MDIADITDITDLASPRYECLDADRIEYRRDRPFDDRLTRSVHVWKDDAIDTEALTGDADLASAMAAAARMLDGHGRPVETVASDPVPASAPRRNRTRE